SQYSKRVVPGVAESVRIAVLPAEFTESRGEDVRDVLRRPGGREQVLQAIADAQKPEGWDATETGTEAAAPAFAAAESPLPEGTLLKLEVSPAGREPQRL